MYQGKYIISGYVNGRKFRPSNWPERLCETGATLDPIKKVMRYSPHLHIAMDDEHGYCVQVNFNSLSTELAQYVAWFIDSNHLTLIRLEQTSNKDFGIVALQADAA